VSRLPSPPHPSLGEIVWEEVVRTALKEGMALGVLKQEKMAKAPIKVEVADTDMVTCIDGGHVNNVEP
jgi:hypothetical protein